MIHTIGNRIRSALAWLARASWRHPFVIVFAFVLAILFSLDATRHHLRIDSSTEDMLSDRLAFRQIHQDFRQAFPALARNIVIVVDSDNADRAQDAAASLLDALEETATRPSSAIQSVFGAQDHPFFRRNGLLYLDTDALRDLSDRLARAQPLLGHLVANPSLDGVFSALELALAQDNAPVVTDFIAALNQSFDAAKMPDRVDTPFSWNVLLAADLGLDRADNGEPTTRRFILVRPVIDFTSLDPADKAIATIRKIATDAENRYGVTIRLTGAIVMEEEEYASVFQSVRVAAVISFIFVLLIVIWALGSSRLIAASMLTLLAGLSLTFGFATLSVGRLNLISVAFSVLYIGLAIDFALQFCLRYREEWQNDAHDSHTDNKGHRIIDATATGVALPIFLAAVAAAIGFLSFLATDYIGLSELGIIAGGGMMIALFTTFTILPALIRLFDGKPSANNKGQSKKIRTNMPDRRNPGSPTYFYLFGDACATWINAHYRWIIVVTFAVLAALVPEASRLRFDADPINLKDPSSPSVQTARDIRNASPLSEHSAVAVTDNIAAATDLAQRFENLETVDYAVSPHQWIPQDQAEKREIIADTALFLLPTLLAGDGVDRPNRNIDRELSARRLRGAIDAYLKADNKHRINGMAHPQKDTGIKGIKNPNRPLRDHLRRLRDHLDRLPTTTDKNHHDTKNADTIDGKAVLQRDSKNSDAIDGKAVLQRVEDHILAGMAGRLDRLAQSLSPDDDITLATLPPMIRERIVAKDGRALVRVYPSTRLAGREELEHFVNDIRGQFPRVTDTPVVIFEAGNIVLNAFIKAGILAVSINLILVWIAVRSAIHTLFVFVPLVCAALAGAALAALWDIPINFANLIALPLLFSLGISYGIYIVLRFRTVGQIRPLILSSTPRAVFFSAATTVASFASLMVATHTGIASMGQLLTISLLCATFFTLVLLPALLAATHQNDRHRPMKPHRQSR